MKEQGIKVEPLICNRNWVNEWKPFGSILSPCVVLCSFSLSLSLSPSRSNSQLTKFLSLSVFLYSWHFIVIWCFKLIGVHIPQSVSVGDTVPIHCIFDLQGSSLYSLKWHKNGREFFRLYRGTSSSLPLTSPAPPTPPFHQASPVGGKGGRRKNQKNKQHHISQQQHQMYQQQTQSTNSVLLLPMPGIDVDVSVNGNSFLPFAFYPVVGTLSFTSACLIYSLILTLTFVVVVFSFLFLPLFISNVCRKPDLKMDLLSFEM